jgi:hypothetical protein
MCAVLAGLLHYSFLTCFGWMVVEGLHIYMKLVLVFEPHFSVVPFFYAIGYLAPAIIVGTAASIKPSVS